jgi:hypothetical protein
VAKPSHGPEQLHDDAMDRQNWRVSMTLLCTHLDPVKTDKPKTAHPIVSSIEPGETWSWCYLNGIFLRVSPHSNLRGGT